MQKYFLSFILLVNLVYPFTKALALFDNIPKAEFYIPFKGPKLPEISEGWKYSTEEQGIHGYVNHSAVDFEAKRGTPVYASADGYAIGSFHLVYLVKMYKDKGPVGFGLGNFVQIWHPQLGVYSSYSHLQKIHSSVAYFPATFHDYSWDPKVVYLPPDFSERNGTFVKKGDIIGYVGDSGLSWGYEEGPNDRPDPKLFPSWDNTHLHFEIYDRNDTTFLKKNRFDPFGFYGELPDYKAGKLGENTLWKTDKNGKVLFAK